MKRWIRRLILLAAPIVWRKIKERRRGGRPVAKRHSSRWSRWAREVVGAQAMGRGPLLEGARLKIDRAAEHLETLHQEVEAYVDDRPYEVVSEPRPEDNRFYSARFIGTLPYQIAWYSGMLS